jgi:hypothetical protein
MSVKDSILDKIKKLLRMKRGGTPDEVATALRLAQDLAEKHGIDLNTVNPDDDNQQRERPISHTDAIHGARIQSECKYAALIADRFFNVSTFTNRGAMPFRITFVGTDWDTQIAVYVYHFLVGHFRREWKTKRGRCRDRQSFMWGMYIGLSSKLRDRQPPTAQQPGLIQVDRALQRRTEYIGLHFGEMKSVAVTPDSNSTAARYRGWLAGQQTEIRSGIRTAEERAALNQPKLQLTA